MYKTFKEYMTQNAKNSNAQMHNHVVIHMYLFTYVLQNHRKWF